VLAAVQETRDALIAFEKEQQRFRALSKAVEAAHAAAELAQNRYTSGLADFDAVLEGQRARLSFQDQLVQSQSAIATSLIRFYKALGGGWQPVK
jgi:outer membrane protein TolC